VLAILHRGAKRAIGPRKLFFGYTAENSHQPKSLNNIKKSTVSRGESISKKVGQKSSKYGEIIKKPCFQSWAHRSYLLSERSKAMSDP
jgi:hypothetical protein